MFDRELVACSSCPHACAANRIMGKHGFCEADAGVNVAAVVIHHGEEPVISGAQGICNVFFRHCNLRCLYCQNHQISQGKSETGYDIYKNTEDVIDAVVQALDQGCPNLGFVSPSHMLPQMKRIIQGVQDRGYRPVIVYNTNAYDRVEMIHEMADMVDVWLPDFKYLDASLAASWSGAADYPQVALSALKAMYQHAGSTLRIENGIAVKGMIIRHLVLPGAVENSLEVLATIARHLSTDVTLSLMSQYYPNAFTAHHPLLGRTLRQEEYAVVVEKLESLGFYKGWVQELTSHEFYRPDFNNEEPFQVP